METTRLEVEQKTFIEKELSKLEVLGIRMLLAYMICMGTYGNGAGIGMELIPVDLLRIQ